MHGYYVNVTKSHSDKYGFYKSLTIENSAQFLKNQAIPSPLSLSLHIIETCVRMQSKKGEKQTNNEDFLQEILN